MMLPAYRFALAGIALLFLLVLPTQKAHAQAEFAVQKISPSGNIETGANFTYILKYVCLSINDSCRGVEIIDQLPQEVEYVDARGSSHTLGTTFNPVTNTVTWDFKDPLPAGTSGEVSVTVKFPAGATGNGTVSINTAQVNIDNGLNGITFPPVEVTSTAIANPVFSKGVDGASNINMPTTYVLEVDNRGTGKLSILDVLLTDTLPAGVDFVSASDGGTYDMATNSVTWPPIDSIGDERVQRSVVVIFPSPTFMDGDAVTNNAYPTYTPSGTTTPIVGPPITVVNIVTDFIPSPTGGGGTPSSRLTKNGGDNERVRGVPQNYSLVLANRSNVPLADAILSDSTIPAQVQVNGASTGSYAPPVPVTIAYRTNLNSVFQAWPGGISTGLINVSVSTAALTLASGEVVTGVRWVYGDTLPVGFTPIIAPAINGTLLSTDRDGNPVNVNDTYENCARFTASYTDTANVTTLINLDDCFNSVVIAPRSEPVLGKGLNPGGPFYPDDIFTYTVTLSNNDGFNSTDMVNPTLADPLPDVVSFIPGTMTYDPGTTGAPAPIFEVDGTTFPGDTLLRWKWTGASAHTFPPDPTKLVTITFKVKLKPLVAPQTFTNTVFVSPEDDNSFCGIIDINDIDGDGSITDQLCSRTSAGTGLLDVASLQTVKGVKGELDTDYSRFPDVGETVPAGTADYELLVINPGNVALTDVVIVDILPYIGDVSVLSGQPRLSEWRPNLNSAINVPAGVSVFYSIQNNPCLTEYDAADSVDCDWSPSLPTFPYDITDVQAVKFNLGSIILEPGDTIRLTWKMRAPVGAPEAGEVAWNSFGTRATRVDNGNQLLATEPVKVGIRLTSPNVDSASIGNFVWRDDNKDGLQDAGEMGLNGIEVILYRDNGDGISDPLTDIPVATTLTGFDQNGNPGFYSFPDLDPGDYFLEFVPRDNYTVTATDTLLNSSDALDSDVDQVTNLTAVTTLTAGEDDPNWDLGLIPIFSSIGDYVWNDYNRDGVQDLGEDPIEGVLVRVLDSLGNLVNYAYTDVNGYYLVDSLLPSLYTVEFVPPATYYPSVEDSTLDDNTNNDMVPFTPTTGRSRVIALDGGIDTVTIDAGFFQMAKLGDFVFYDENYNGFQDGGLDVGIAGVTVSLYDAVEDTLIATTTTDATGYYEFDSLFVDFSYVVEFGTPTGYTTTLDNEGVNDAIDSDMDPVTKRSATVILSPDEFNQTLDAGFYIAPTLGDFVWLDEDADGEQDTGEPGLAGVTVNLLDASGNFIKTTTTGLNGEYEFTDLLPGTGYIVEFELPVGSKPSPQDETGVLDTDDSDYDPTTGRTGIIILASDEDNPTIDAGIWEPVSLGNYVWVDENGDGVQDASEPAIPNVPVLLFAVDGVGNLTPAIDADGVAVSTTVVTDINGEYNFTNLPPGDYVVQITAPGVYVPTLPQTADPNGNEGDDSNIDITKTVGNVHQSALVSLLSGDEPVNDGDSDNSSNLTVDFGLIEPVSLGDYVWLDKDGDGTQNEVGTGLDGVTVELFVLNSSGVPVPAIDVDRVLIPSTLTASGGAYQFDNLPPGEYVVRITPPTGYFATPVNTADPDNNDNIDSNIDGTRTTPAGSFESAPVTIHVNQENADGDANNDNNPSIDFGLVEPMSLGDYVWIDNNFNGLQDDGATGLDGITVDLFVIDENGLQVAAVDVNGIPVLSTTTSGGGNYEFENLPPGDYVVRFTPPVGSGYIPSAIQQSNTNIDNDNDSNIDDTRTTPAGSFETGVVTMVNDDESIIDGDTDGNTNLTIDVGFIQPLSIGNYVWHDVNGNGTQDGTEPGIDGVAVTLLVDNGSGVFGPATDINGVAIPAQNTSGGGLYNFTNLPAGNYVVQVAEPTGFDATPIQNANVNDNDNTDSNIDFTRITLPNTYQSAPIELSLDGEPTNDGDANNDSNLSVDFGFVQPMSLGNYIWVDENGDGIQDSGEPAVPNVPVVLFAVDALGNLTPAVDLDGVTATTTTNASGEYNFTNIAPGDYVVQITAPAGYVPTLPQSDDPDNDLNTDSNIDTTRTTPVGVYQSAPLTLENNDEPVNDGDVDNNSNLSVDFGLIEPVSLGNYVWVDENGDGIQDETGTGLDGVTVELFLVDGSGALVTAIDVDQQPVPSTTTSGGGAYQFDNLPPGDYVVRITPPTGYFATPVNTADPQNNINTDSNIDTTRTTPTGSFESSPITLAVNQEVTDGDADNDNNPSVDFGLVQPMSLGDYVWIDNNGNGLQDETGTGFNGVTVDLFVLDQLGNPIQAVDVNGAPIAATTTANNGTNDGAYGFDNLPPGDYIVRFTPPATYLPALTQVADPNVDANNDSNIDGATTVTTPPTGSFDTDVIVMINNDESDTDGDTDTNSNRTIDAGFIQTVSLGNFVWEDLNGDGEQTTGEPGIDGVRVDLLVDNGMGTFVPATDVDGVAVPFQNTSGGGLYNFTNLPPGNYVVQVTEPTGFDATPIQNATVNDDDNTDSNIDFTRTTPAGTYQSAPVELSVDGEPTNDGDANDDSNLSVDFGFVQPLSLGNFIWEDRNADGNQDAGEPGIPNATVALFLPDGVTPVTDLDGNTVISTTTNAQGEYSFTNLPPGDYIIQVTPLLASEYYATPVNTTDPEDDNNDDSNIAGPGATAGSHVSDLITLVSGMEPTNDDDNDENSNLTLDMGFFQSVAVGDTVFVDANGDGQQNGFGTPGGDRPLGNSVVEIFFTPDDGTTLLPVTDADGNTVGSQITGPNGYYLFDDLVPGDYVIRVTPPASASAYIPTNSGGDPDNNNQDDSNGEPVAATYVQSSPVTLHANTEDQDNDGDDNLNSTVDFGFFEGLAIGDLIWLDSDINGRQDTVGSVGSSEVPLEGFEVILYKEDRNNPGTFNRATDRSGNILPPQTTGPNGTYAFGNLPPGEYVVEVIPPAGSDYLPTTVNESDPNTDLNDDSNIAQEITAGVYRSGVIELRDDGEPDDDGDGSDGNRSIDFGFFSPVSLGNRVWLDLNADGIQDPTEVGIDGVTLTLQVFDPAANAGAGGYVDAVDVQGNLIPAQVTMSAGTDAGFYEFTDLPPGDYIVTMPASNWNATGPFGPNGLYESALGTATQGGDTGNNTDDNGGRDFELPDPTNPLDPGITSLPINLVANNEPIDDGDIDPNSDLSVDFGVTQPFSIGNQIFFDLNNDGLNDVTEGGVDGVAVELYEDDGLGMLVQVGTTQTTAGGGYYLFSKLPPGDYTVVLPASNFVAGGPLEGYHSSGTSILADGNNTETTAIDPDNDLDNDDNGTLMLAGPFPGAVVSAPVTLGVNPFEPTSDNDTTPPNVIDPAPDFLTNYTIDFGFYTTSLGNQVWEDQNNNGVRDTGEPAIQGVLVELLSADGLTVLDTDMTNGNGRYKFEDLPEGDYQIRLTPPSGFVSSTGTVGQDMGPYEPAVDPNTVNVNNDDNGTNGTGTSAGYVISPIITQDAGNEHDVDPTDGSSEDRRVDFGLFEPLNIGNRVYLDDDGVGTQFSTANNGEQDINEPGIANVALTLYLDANGDGTPDTQGSPIATTTTDANGYYMFDYLIEGTYVIGIDANNFAIGQPLDTLFSSTISDPTPNNDEDLDDNGIDDLDYETNGIFSGPITLVDDMEPTNDNDKGPDGDGLADNNNSNLSVDFGFVAPATYGDFVWEDINQDGLQDATEAGVAGVEVTLYEFDPVTMTIIRTVGTETTDANGEYLFEELAPNRYYYASYGNLPAGYVVTGPSASPNDSIDSDVNPLNFNNVPTLLSTGEDDLTWDMGIYLPLASVGDYVWIDLDKDGYQEAGEPAVAGVKVILFDANGTRIDSVLTDANGRYRFENLQPGDYFIEFDNLPADYVFSPANQNPNDAGDSDADPVTGRTPIFTLDPGEFDPNWDAGIYLPTASLGDRVWYDSNNDGIQDTNEAGVPNVKVVLYDGNGMKVDSTLTDAQGYYMFDELTPQDYIVEFKDLPVGYDFTDDGQGTDGAKDSDANPTTGFTTTITLGSGENNPNIDAGIYRPLASIGDRVWEDLNEDGIQDTNEPGVGGVTVVLRDGNGLAVGQTTTDPNGNYSFTNLTPGDYSVTFSNLPTGYQFTGQDVGLNDSLDSDADPVTGQTIVTTLVGGENDPTWDAGIFQPKASLGDYVWEDDNENGIQDGVEMGVQGVKVILFDGNGTKLDSTTTNANGFYLFDMLDPGDYYVQFKDIPTDYVFSPKDAASNDVKDSDADVNTGVTAPVTLSAGQDYRDLDAGIYLPKASLGDKVWSDFDNDGVQDPGEPGVAGVKVVLYDNNGNRIDSTTTNLNGDYLFDDLTPGTYQVGFENTPLGSTFSPQNTGGVTDDSNADPTTGITAPVTLAPGEDNRDVDAGINLPLASLGNFVWNDFNEDGIQDANEPGVGGVKVILLDGAGNKLDSTVTDSQGAYDFTGLTPGIYAVQFTDLPTDFVFTGQDQGNDAADSDADPVTGNTATVTLTAGQNYPDFDAGIYQPKAALGDKVWLDLDKDGEQDVNEPGVPNVNVVLYDGTGAAIDSVLTDANGNYLFPNLVPGDYVVQFKDLPADHDFSPQDNANDADDSDADQQGFTATVTLGPGETNLTVDAGIIPPTASLGDYVWYDLDEDGVQDANEPPVGGIQVVLTDANGNPLDTTYTDASGQYLFEDLPGGDYIVFFPNIPTDYRITDPTQGGDNTMDSDVDPTTGQTGIITLLPGEENVDLDAGLAPICVTDCVAEAYMPGGFAMLFTSGTYPGSDNRWVFDAAGGSFKTYLDGTARLSGSLVNASDNSLTYDMNLRLVNVKDWGQWTTDGGQVKGAPNGPFMTWDFFEVDSLNSYLTGMNDTLWLSHMPVSRTFGFQLGEGANDKNSNYGLGGWWFFNSTSGNYAGTGDFNVNLDCQAGCGSPAPVANQLGAMALLQGPYDTNIGKMRTDLRAQNILPSTQPFNRAPWNYIGTEVLGTLAPDSIVDWILVEMRDVNDQTIVLSTQAALLLKGGEIVQPDGHSLIQIPQQLQSFYLVIHNWNHLAVMSAAPVQKYGNVYYHDFSQASGIYTDVNNPNPAAVTISGTTLLYQGDATGDSQINSLDLGNVMLNYFNSGSNATDINLDGVVNSLDVGRAMQNYFKQSHVPE